MIATLRVARIALGTRCRRPRSETRTCLLVRPPISGARSVDDCDAPRRADRARNPLPSSSLGDEHVSPRSSSYQRRAIRDSPFSMRAVNSILPGMEKPLIKVAVPNKGSLSEPAAEMLRQAGYSQRSDGELALLDEVNGVEFFY